MPSVIAGTSSRSPRTGSAPAPRTAIAAVSLRAFVLLAAGGFLYSVGVLFYRWHRLPYQRAIWHGFVLTAAACQYFAILDVVAS